VLWQRGLYCIFVVTSSFKTKRKTCKSSYEILTHATEFNWHVSRSSSYRPAQKQAKETMDGQCQGDRLSKSEDLHWRRSNSQHCSWTKVNGKNSSLTGHRPIPVLRHKAARHNLRLLNATLLSVSETMTSDCMRAQCTRGLKAPNVQYYVTQATPCVAGCSLSQVSLLLYLRRKQLVWLKKHQRCLVSCIYMFSHGAISSWCLLNSVLHNTLITRCYLPCCSSCWGDLFKKAWGS